MSDMGKEIMKFIANPDKYYTIIALCILVSIAIVFFSIRISWLLIFFLPIWLFLCIGILLKDIPKYTVLDNQFRIEYFRKTFELPFSQIEYIVEYVDYTNPKKISRFELKTTENSNIHGRMLFIENRCFADWLNKHPGIFKYKKAWVL